MATIRVGYTIPFGTNVRIGYRLKNTSSPFTYITPFPSYADAPYYIDGLALGDYEVELTPVCPNCNGANYGNPIVYPAIIL